MTPDSLLDLLPALYRQRDVDAGGALEALLQLVDEVVLGPLAGDVAQLYDDAFIETCAPWVVPYIGDLLGVSPLRDTVGGGGLAPRAYVANTIAYRRRKGTAAVVEQVARDVTGWPARVVEGFERLIANQHLDHVRPGAVVAPDLRRADDLELTGSPFEITTRTVDVRRIGSGRDGYNLPDLVIHLWRLTPYPLERAEARLAAQASGQHGEWRFLLDPLGRTTSAFRPGRTEDDIAQLAVEADVPAPLRRRPLYAELEERRRLRAIGATEQQVRAAAIAFGDQPVFTVAVDGDVVAPEDLHVCHLGSWRPPPAPAGAGRTASVDPVLGRVVVRGVPAAATPPDVRVSWSYGLSGDLGGGPYDRRADVDAWRAENGHATVTWQVGVARDPEARAGNPDPTQLFDSLTAALDEWREQPPGTVGMIVVLDSSTYVEELTGTDAVMVPAGSRLAVVAGDWPVEPDPDAVGLFRRVDGGLDPIGRRPCVRGAIEVAAPAGSGDADPARLVLDGLAVDGALTVTEGDLGLLLLSHCTLTPSGGGLTVDVGADPTQPGARHERLRVDLRRCITGRVTLASPVPQLAITDSIVDGAITAPGATLDVTAITVFGAVASRQLAASSTIFTEPVVVERRQAHDVGDLACVRFSFVPPEGSAVPRRHRCQPDLAVEAATRTLPPDTALTADERRLIAAAVTPTFTSRAFDHPAYGQLGLACPAEITTGGEDETAMGAFGFLRDPWRAANAARAIVGYVRFGLETGVDYPT